MTHESLLSLARMAHCLGVPQTWLRQEADAGRIPHLKAGSRYLFNPKAVEPLLIERAAKQADTVEGGEE